MEFDLTQEYALEPHCTFVLIDANLSVGGMFLFIS